MKSIYIPIESSHIDVLDCIRRDYDSLYGKIPAHVTLVFPFLSELDEGLVVSHIREVLACEKQFSFTLGFTLFNDNGTCYIPIEKGANHITSLNSRLYSGCLSSYRSLEYEFVPHVTIARSVSPDKIIHVESRAESVFGTNFVVKEVVLENIGKDGSGKVVISTKLAVFP
ncbi:2'-5' RNA ligase family protein [Celerinatantimonas yamalensis]|uniref:2'-5' RNA ligase family protein n=1 Tax=Celerinatantimonas yamalensis TaxID=559956 RepID=A0ABW9G2J1_9GAMM